MMTRIWEWGIKAQPAVGWSAALTRRVVDISQEAAYVLAVFLTPAAVAALALGLWRFGVDLGWAENFFISTGLFSHWIVWIAVAIALRILAGLPQPKREPVQQLSSRG